MPKFKSAIQADNGITFTSDTNLYRFAADVLKTDDSFTVGATLNALAVNINGVPAASTMYVQSRGTNLITNGSGLLGTNYNFSGFTFDPVETHGGGGSFSKNVATGVVLTDELIPVDPTKAWRLVGWGKSGDASGANYSSLNRQYLGLGFFDIDGLSITPTQANKVQGSTDTTLAVDLINGATTITLTDATGWYNSTDPLQRRMSWWPYTNSKGYTYPDYTYTRNVSPSNTWAAAGISGNVITLVTPWAGGTLLAGTKVRNVANSGTYKYIALSNVLVPNTWTRYEGYLQGVETNGVGDPSMFPSGTAYTKVLFLINYHGSADNIIRWSDLSLTDVSVRNLETSPLFTGTITVNNPTGKGFVASGKDWGDTTVQSFYASNAASSSDAFLSARSTDAVLGTTKNVSLLFVTNSSARMTITGAGVVSTAGNLTVGGNLTVTGTTTFTGVPTLPSGAIAVTQTAGNSTTAIATTAFVTTADALKANLASPSFTGTIGIGTAATANALVNLPASTTLAAGGLLWGTDANLYRSGTKRLTMDYGLTLGEAASTSSQLTVIGGASGGNMITLSRTSGVTTTFSWALGGGGLSFSDDVAGYITANIFGDLSTNAMYLGQRGRLVATARPSLLSAETFATAAGADVAGNALRLQGGLGVGTSAPGDVDIFTGNTALTTVAHTSTVKLRVKATTGQVQLPVTGSAAGLLIGGDANLYRAAADVLATDDSLQVKGAETASRAFSMAMC